LRSRWIKRRGLCLVRAVARESADVPDERSGDYFRFFALLAGFLEAAFFAFFFAMGMNENSFKRFVLA